MAVIAALAELGEIMGMADIAGEISTAEWSILANSARAARAPTIKEAIIGATGVGGALGLQPAINAIAENSMSRAPSNRVHRRFQPYNLRPRNNAPTPPDSNSPSSGNMDEEPDYSGDPRYHGPFKAKATSGTSAEEVPVKPVPRNLSKVVPNHFTINLPHEFDFELNPNVYTQTNTLEVARIRLNSIYDPIVGLTSNAQPQGRDLWAGHFKYYRVLSTHVKIMILSRMGCHVAAIGGAGYGLFLWGYELVDQDQTTCGDYKSFLVSKHAKRQLLKPPQTGVFYDPTTSTAVSYPMGSSSSTLSYMYYPESWDYHVREEGSEERWTPVKQNPSVDHDLVVRLFHLDPSAPYNDPDGVKIMMQMNYTVQFMEEEESAYKIRDTSPATYGGAGEDAADV